MYRTELQLNEYSQLKCLYALKGRHIKITLIPHIFRKQSEQTAEIILFEKETRICHELL